MRPWRGHRGLHDPLNGKRYASPLKHLEHVLPLERLPDPAAVRFRQRRGIYRWRSTSRLCSIRSPWGIIPGLFVGKPLGIFTISWLAVKSGIANCRKGVNFRQIFAVSILCGIGFTMSMFIASLAFESMADWTTAATRLGILAGSTLAAVIGYIVCGYRCPIGRRIKVRRGYEKTRMVSHAGKPALWADSLADCQLGMPPRQVVLPISTGWSTAHSCWGLTGKSPVRRDLRRTGTEQSRAGERVKLSNKRYCTERMPDAGRLKGPSAGTVRREQG